MSCIRAFATITMGIGLCGFAQNPQYLGFQEPQFTADEAQRVLEGYQYLDPSHVVPDDLLKAAVLYFDFNRQKISNPTVLGVIDLGKHSSEARWFFIDMLTGKVVARHVAHGRGSDPSSKKYPHGTGYATRFSNVNGSEATSRGFFLAAETYTGDHGVSVRLDGLSETNSNARDRDVVVHSADYVVEENKLQGRSLGCFAVAQSEHDAVVNQIQGGSLIYAEISKN